MSDPDEPYRPRESDHLVEPMFAGLGVGDEGPGEGRERERADEEDRRRAGFLRRLARFLLGRR